MSGPWIFISAGDPSGEMHAARLIARLREMAPGLRVTGIGGPAMQEAGAELLCSLDRLAVMGLAEVAGSLWFFFRLLAETRQRLRRDRPDLVVLVDFPDFNLRLAAEAKKLGLPVLYYISPQVWAWRQGRRKKIAALADRLAVVFPFEKEFYRGLDLEVEFVGHPLMEAPEPPPRGEFCRVHGLDPGRHILGLMPGSRTQELKRHLDIFLGAARLIRRERGDVQFALGLLPHTAAALSGQERQALRDLGVRSVLSESSALIAHSRVLITKSGTTTMEAALAGTPMVIGYRTSPLSYSLARRLVRVEHIGMPNLLVPRPEIPELVQEALTPEAVAQKALGMIEDSSPLRQRILDQCAAVRELLATPRPASLRVAEIVLEMCGKGKVNE
jgi:lipid-A-disaccharide synthase